MNTYTLLKLVQHPDRVKAEDIPDLQEELRRHPYFQAIRVLIAKASNSSEYIKNAVAYTADRSVLMRVLDSSFNADVNLPNIDHLDIQKEDINAFDRLGRDEDDVRTPDIFKARLEALAEGIEGADEIPVLQHDSLVDATIFDEPVRPTEETSPELPAEPLLEAPDSNLPEAEPEISSTPAPEALVEEPKDERTEDFSAMHQALAWAADKETSASIEEVAQEGIEELRRMRDEVMKQKEEAEAEMEAMSLRLQEEIKAIAPESPIFEEPKYENPFTDDIASGYAPPQDAPAYEFPVQQDEPVAVESPVSAIEPASLPSQADPQGAEDHLFGLDAWLDDRPASLAQPSVPFVYKPPVVLTPQEEENGMTLEEKIKAQSSIISNFIEKAGSIGMRRDSLDQDAPKEDLSQASTAPNNFISENLASIMVRQGKYDQAIKIYKQLILKYPEKKSYFADLIENLENKQ